MSIYLKKKKKLRYNDILDFFIQHEDRYENSHRKKKKWIERNEKPVKKKKKFFENKIH